ncbi:MAG: chromosomal replication initiator protein DnaA [candidate division CPR2 bacterium GW2011_GWC1_39_9]|uniref:Chromosomal replication initiator protein DnaA n=1 Tax=candidate division CPR2 bacterium GW2011_GWC2_39_10 TaxID=1618345 RepID=A0A0G0PZZ0_UNCC2|nr:MAG: chromosomal replication initiator protein DnaA [candidate division CPR2 bacterium GW2011_GWC2_39_10]KKR34261.1 MAG: chromosomal replication initiator protein DnaA [candidate division CPR2 bacterium GW2011_GWC1_39_9]
MDNTNLWQAVLGQLEITLSKANFATWFKNTSILSQDDGKIVVSVPNVYTQEWLGKKFHKEIFAAFTDLLKGDVQSIEYKVGSGKAAVFKKNSSQPTISIDEKINTSSFEETPLKSTKTNLNPKLTFESFVVGASNRLAYAAAQSVAADPGNNYNPLFIYGGVGLGKTHLMQAVGNAILKKDPKKKIGYTTSEIFTNEFIASLSKKTTNHFKEKYRTVDLLLIDDMQFIAGKEQTQEEFFHTFNALHQANKQIILTSDRVPKAIPTLEERLRSRFEWGMIADIQPPDLETRIAILQRKAQARGFDMPLDIIDYIARNVQHNIRELEGALTRIMAYCELNGSAPSVSVAHSLLGNIISNPRKRALSPKQVIEQIAGFYDLQVDEITGPKRDKDIVTPRQICMYLMREELALSYPKIAQSLGGRDHTTIMHGCHKIEKEIDINEHIRQEINLLKERLYMA